MRSYSIAVYPGDGIGPEVIEGALAVLDAVVHEQRGFELRFTHYDWGLAHWEQHGEVVPENFLELLRPHDAILLGSVGWPARVPDHITLAPLVKLRQTFDQYA